MNSPTKAGLISIGLVLLLGAAFLLAFERVTETNDRDYGGEAATNDFFAAELLFEEMGVDAEDVHGLNRLPPTDHTILMLAERSTEGVQQQQRLIDWVHQGGHLVALPVAVLDVQLDHTDCDDDDYHYDSEEDDYEDYNPDEELGTDDTVDTDEALEETQDEEPADPILELFAATVDKTPHEKWDAWIEDDSPVVLVEVHLGGKVFYVDMDPLPLLQTPGTQSYESSSYELFSEAATEPATETDGVETDRVEFDRDEDDAAGEDSLAESSDYLSFTGFTVARFKHGEGRITLLSDRRAFYNGMIEYHDHAAYAWEIVAPESSPRPAGIWIVGRDRFPTLGELLSQHAWMVQLSGALLLGFFLWSRGVRFGPLLSDRPPERRSVLEHIRASGDFLWRSKSGEALLESTRSSLLKTAHRKDPSLSRLDQREQIQRIAEKAGISGGQLNQALTTLTVNDPNEFTRLIRTLELTRRSL